MNIDPMLLLSMLTREHAEVLQLRDALLKLQAELAELKKGAAK